MKKFLIVLFLSVTYNFSLNAQEAEPVNDNAQITVQTFFESAPKAGKPWSLTLIIDYPDPDQVTVAVPPFGVFTMERSIKSPRLIDDRIQTVVDYRFITNRTGLFILEPFVVVCPSGIKKTEPLHLNITSETPELAPIVLKLTWEGVPLKAEAGERSTISLFSNVQNLQQLPPGFFIPEVPAGLILSSLKLTEQETSNGFYAKFDIIPLDGNIYLPSRVIQSENTIYEIPALRITVINRAAENVTGISYEGMVKHQFNEEDFIFSNMTEENKKTRILRLLYFYSAFFLVIFTIVICLYLLIKKK
jgi:hypothetical protein